MYSGGAPLYLQPMRSAYIVAIAAQQYMHTIHARSSTADSLSASDRYQQNHALWCHQVAVFLALLKQNEGPRTPRIESTLLNPIGHSLLIWFRL